MAYERSDINNCFFTGRLTADPKRGKNRLGAWIYFSLAINQRIYDTERQQYLSVPIFIDCFGYDDIATKTEGKLFKGTQVYIQCTMCMESRYSDKKGYSPEHVYFQIKNIDIGKQSKKRGYNAPMWNPPPVV